MLVTELLKNNARLYPDQEALVAVETGAVVPFDEAAYRAARRCVTWSAIQRDRKPGGQLLPRPGARPRKQGGDPADELSGVAAAVFRDFESRGCGGAAELPVYKCGHRAERGFCGGGGAGLRHLQRAGSHRSSACADRRSLLYLFGRGGPVSSLCTDLGGVHFPGG